MTKKIEDGGLPEDLIDASAAICRGLGIASTPTNCFPIIKGIQADRQRDQWQPIETAPKDKTPVIIAVPTKDMDDFHVGEAYFDPEHYGNGDWWWAGTSYGDYHGGPISDINHHAPTHWMSLPSPPRALQQKGSSNG